MKMWQEHFLALLHGAPECPWSLGTDTGSFWGTHTEAVVSDDLIMESLRIPLCLFPKGSLNS